MVTVSDTAFAIAAIRAEESTHPERARLFTDPFASIFRADDDEAKEAIERFVGLPGMREAVRLRTRFLDDFVREGVRSGARQLVLFGAGLDTRALRMDELAPVDARVFEVDFAALLDRKRAILAAAGVSLPPRVAYVGCDFMDADFAAPLGRALEEAGFRLGARTLFVWEGVLAYIDDAAIARSLAFMATHAGEGGAVAFDFAAMRFDPVPAKERVIAAGFRRFEEARVDDLWRRWIDGEPLPMIEAIGLRMGVATR